MGCDSLFWITLPGDAIVPFPRLSPVTELLYVYCLLYSTRLGLILFLCRFVASRIYGIVTGATIKFEVNGTTKTDWGIESLFGKEAAFGNQTQARRVDSHRTSPRKTPQGVAEEEVINTLAQCRLCLNVPEAQDADRDEFLRPNTK